MQKTPFAGLTELDISESLTEDNGAFTGRDRETIDRFLQIGAKTHRHDGSAGLTNPTNAPSASVVASGGTIAPDVALNIGYTAQDGQRGETTLSPVTVVTTADPLSSPPFAPSAEIVYDSGELLESNYYYGITWVDSEGGETPLGPVISTTRQPGYEHARVLLSHLDAGMAEAGATAWRLYRQKGGGTFAYLASGAGASFVDDGTGEAVCDTNPPNDNFNTTNSVNTLLFTLPSVENLPAGTEFINVYVSQTGAFSGTTFLDQFPVASAGTTQIYRALELSDDQPPDVNSSVGGATKIDPDTELEDWHWKRPVEEWEDLPAGEFGDVRLVESEGRLWAVLNAGGATNFEDWTEITGGGGGGGGEGSIRIVQGEDGEVLIDPHTLTIFGSGIATTESVEGETGEAVVRITVPPTPGPPGPTGASGANGKDGKDGTSGAVGPAGPAGSGALAASAMLGTAITPTEKLTILGSGAASTSIQKGTGNEAIITVTVPSVAGPAGASGAPGIPGASGVPGASGAPGIPGASGANGKDGAPGVKGDTGLAGASASVTVRASGVSVKNAGVLDFGSGATVAESPTGTALVTILQQPGASGVQASAANSKAPAVGSAGKLTFLSSGGLKTRVYPGAAGETIINQSGRDEPVTVDFISESPAETGNLSWTHKHQEEFIQGVLVLVVQNGTAEDQVTKVEYGGVALTELPNSPFLHTLGTEDCTIHAYFRGKRLPDSLTGSTVKVTNTGANVKKAVCYTFLGDEQVELTAQTGASESASETALSENVTLITDRTGTQGLEVAAFQSARDSTSEIQIDTAGNGPAFRSASPVQDFSFDFGNQVAAWGHMSKCVSVNNYRLHWKQPAASCALFRVLVRPVREDGLEVLPIESAAVGDRCKAYGDEANGVIWDLYYDGVGEFPWKKIGGPPIFGERNTTRELNNQATFVSLPTDPISVTAPYKGDYDIRVEADFIFPGTPGTSGYISYAIGATAASEVWQAAAQTPSGTSSLVMPNGKTTRQLGVAAGASIVEKAKTAGAWLIQFRSRRLIVDPVRLSNS